MWQYQAFLIKYQVSGYSKKRMRICKAKRRIHPKKSGSPDIGKYEYKTYIGEENS